MNYQKAINSLILLACLSFNAFAELKPYTAIYDVYSRGFHVGIATQTLEKLNDHRWLIKLHTEPQGFASFMQSKPIIQEHVFKYIKQQPLLLSARSNSGKSDKNAKKIAYFDQTTKKLYIKNGHQAKQIQTSQPLISFLALPTTVLNMKPHQAIELSLYEKGKVRPKVITYLGLQNNFNTMEVSQVNSSKKLRYLFKADNMQVPLRIEKLKKGKVKAYLELKSFINE